MPLQSTTKDRTKTSLTADSRTTIEQRKLQKAIEEAERGIAEGQWVEHAEVEEKLKRWAAGGT